MTLPTHRIAVIAVLVIATTRLASAQKPAVEPAKDEAAVAFGVTMQLGSTPDAAQKVATQLAEQAETFICEKTQTVAQGAVPQRCGASAQCIQKLGQDANSKRVALITLIASGGTVRLQVQLFASDTGQGGESKQVTYKAEPPEEFASAAKKLLGQLFPQGGKECPTPKAKKPDDKADGKTEGGGKNVEIPDPKEVAEKVEGSGQNADDKNDKLVKGGKKPHGGSGTNIWLWGGVGAAVVAIASVAIYAVATSEEELPQLALPPPTP